MAVIVIAVLIFPQMVILVHPSPDDWLYEPWLSVDDFEASGLFTSTILDYAIDNGTKHPGDLIQVIFHSKDLDLKDMKGFGYYIFLEVNENGRFIKIVHWDAAVQPFNGLYSWNVTLPNCFPAHYKFGVAIWDSNNKVLGKLIATITVPMYTIEATITLDKHEYNRYDKIIYNITNTGEVTILYGYPYSIERKVGDAWIDAGSENIFISLGLLSFPGETSSLTIDLRKTWNLWPGIHRIVKDFSADANVGVKKVITTEFMIVDSNIPIFIYDILFQINNYQINNYLIFIVFIIILLISVYLIKRYHDRHGSRLLQFS
jgi:hypothetical protein